MWVRVWYYCRMILDVEEKGFIMFGKIVLIEFMSGNMGVVLVMVGCKRGYKVMLVMFNFMFLEWCMVFWVLDVEVVFIG